MVEDRDRAPAAPPPGDRTAGPVAFVLGGGGVLGAVEVGMLRALFRAGIRPDLVLGTSIGAVNGVLVAADPTPDVTDRLVRLWASPEAGEVYGDSVARQLRRFAARTHLHSPRPLRRLLERELAETATFADLRVTFQCCAASIERAAEHWFEAGSVVDAVLASASVPGLLPPAEVDGEHYVDGGIVNSIPVGRAVELGARQIYVLQVGRIERALTPPRRPWEVAQVAFEIARRHRFAREMAELPAGVDVYVLPTGGGDARDDSPWAYRDMAAVGRRISRAYLASRRYLADQAGAGGAAGPAGAETVGRGGADAVGRGGVDADLVAGLDLANGMDLASPGRPTATVDSVDGVDPAQGGDPAQGVDPAQGGERTHPRWAADASDRGAQSRAAEDRADAR